MKHANGKKLPILRHEVQPVDIVYGLGSADRNLLAACLALFEDSTLSRRLGALYDRAVSKVSNQPTEDTVQSTADAVKNRMTEWMDSPLSDNSLRLALWVYLRDAFGLSARVCLSERSATRIANDLTAAALHSSGTERATLADLVLSVLESMLATALKEGAGQMDPAAQVDLISKVRTQLEQMDEDAQRELLKSIGAEELNDAAVRKILLTAGGLTAFSTSVGLAGFSAYILAAQASAFIPLISGPALVSIVAVLSNPITVIGASAAAMWWFARSASNKIRAEVAVKVLSLLALQGMSAGRNGVRGILESFTEIESLKPFGDLSQNMILDYRTDWGLLASIRKEKRKALAPQIAELMNRPAVGGYGAESRLRRMLFPEPTEVQDTAVVGLLTLGDIVYSAAAIEPLVIKAADFARVEDLESTFAFADFARRVHELSPRAMDGAIDNVKGYTAEQVVAAELVAQGHQVSFPETPNEAGWDLLVDGVKTQVKCYDGLSGLQDHFSRYDFPVYANSELAEKIAKESPDWADKVYFVEGYSDEIVTHITDESIAAGDGVLTPNVPVFALGVSAARNLLGYSHGKITGAQAVEQFMLDGSTRAGLAAFGGFVGHAIGLLAFGPAGALVFGATVPVLSQAQSNRVKGALDKYITSESYKSWSVEAGRALNNMIGSLTRSLSFKEEIGHEKRQRLGTDVLADYVRARLEDDAWFLAELRLRLGQIDTNSEKSIEQKAAAVLAWTGTSPIHPALYQSELNALNTVMQARPGILARCGQHGRDGLRVVVSIVDGFKEGWSK